MLLDGAAGRRKDHWCPLQRTWPGWHLGLGSGPGNRESCAGPLPWPAPCPPPLSPQQRKGQTLAGAGRGLGSWRSVCFGLIPAFLLLPGPGPQIRPFLFGLGQGSAAPEALAPLGKARCFPALRNPPPQPGRLAPAPNPSPFPRRSPRGRALGEHRKFRLGTPAPQAALTLPLNRVPEAGEPGRRRATHEGHLAVGSGGRGDRGPRRQAPAGGWLPGLSPLQRDRGCSALVAPVRGAEPKVGSGGLPGTC